MKVNLPVKKYGNSTVILIPRDLVKSYQVEIGMLCTVKIPADTQEKKVMRNDDRNRKNGVGNHPKGDDQEVTPARRIQEDDTLGNIPPPPPPLKKELH